MNKARNGKDKSVDKGKSLKKRLLDLLLRRKGDEEEELTFKETISCLRYHYKNLHAWYPKLFYLGIFRVVPDTLIPIFSILLPTMVVKGLQEKWSVEKYGGYVGGIIFTLLLLNLMNAKIQTILTEETQNYLFKYISLMFDKKMEVDYDILETEDFQDKQASAFHWIAGWTEPVERTISTIGATAACIIGMTAYAIILARQSWIILIFIIMAFPINAIMYERARNSEKIMQGETWKIRRQMDYINNQAMDFSTGKDIRLFEMKKWFLDMYHKLLKKNEKSLCNLQFQYFLIAASDAILVFIRDCLAYIYLIFQIAHGRMTVTDFVLYTGIVAGFSTWSGKFQNEVLYINRGGVAFHDIRECFKVQNKWKGSAKATAGTTGGKKEGVSIEFKDVSFSYGGEKDATISQINLKIEKGEKFALVGLNGAGKTTLVKLLCGFYHPTEGKILVNGISIDEYDRDEYYSMISAVFQEAQMLPVSIAENISCDTREATDISRVKECLRLSGLEEKIKKLSQGEQTLLVRELSAEAIDLSGGEKQKLLLSRALYKDSPFLILDEPTAALDPIAENEIYLKYRDLTVDRTSLFISHRLSSTRFCDRIILLENGRIIEEGTHDSLMEQNGKYANMFEIQSRYYKEEEKEKQKKKREEGDMSYVL